MAKVKDDEKETKNDIRLIDEAFAAQKKYHTAWAMFDRYYRGIYCDEHIQKVKKTKRSNLFVPVIRNIINITKSIFTTSFFPQGTCPIEILPVSDGDKENTVRLNKVVKYYYDKSTPQKALTRAFWSAITLQLGIVLTYWYKDSIKTQDIFIKDIAFDPEARDIDDVHHLAYRFTENGADIIDKYDNKFYTNNKKKILGEDMEACQYRRYEIRELIKRDKDGWKCRTYCNGKLMRETVFDRNPFQYGYALDEYKHIDIDLAKQQVMVYGCSMVWMLKEIQDEINIKRNQKNDVQEEILNPTYLVNTAKLTINPTDLRKGPGSQIKVKGDLIPSNIMPRPIPGIASLDNDLAVLNKQDLEDASGLNGIQRGQTSTSDRRSAPALSIVNANSSTRIEDMVMLINLTLFNHWAKTFVYLVFKHAPDDVINKILEEDGHPLGKIGEREPLEYNIKTSFGATINKEAKIQDILSIVQFLLQSPNANPVVVDGFIKEFVTMKLGDDSNLKDLFINIAPPPPQEKTNEGDEASSEATADPNELREKQLIAGGGV